MLLPGKVGTIGQPNGQHFGIQCLAVFDAGDVVIDGLFPDAGIGMCERAEFIRQGLSGLVLKSVGIDGVDAQAIFLQMAFHRLRVFRNIPGDVQGNGIRGTVELVQ